MNLAQQEQTVPDGNYVIAQTAKILDNPNISQTLAECWEQEILPNLKPTTQKPVDFQKITGHLTDYISKLYPLIHNSGSDRLPFDPVYPTRSQPYFGQVAESMKVAIKEKLLENKKNIKALQQ